MTEHSSSSGFSDIEDLKAFTASDMQRVNRVIEDYLRSDVVLINQLAAHIIHSGGKRLRPMLVMLAARACGHDPMDGQDALLAATVEFIHTATLLHDDVVDESEMRRGQQTASSIWGNEAAVLVGDYLYSRAFQMMVRARSLPIMNLMADTTNTIAQGEVMQLLNINDPDTSEESYHRVIYAKTACLFEAAARTGAILTAAGDAVESALADYGRHLGIAFQLVDDALDYEADSEEMGKNVGDDLAEGKPTLPLIHALEKGDEEQRALIRHAIENGGLEQIEAITAAIRQTGALDYTHRQAIEHAEQARAALAALPPTPARDALAFIADFAVRRSY
jgi:octaprenyl-diphosphate synthase